MLEIGRIYFGTIHNHKNLQLWDPLYRLEEDNPRNKGVWQKNDFIVCALIVNFDLGGYLLQNGVADLIIEAEK